MKNIIALILIASLLISCKIMVDEEESKISVNFPDVVTPPAVIDIYSEKTEELILEYEGRERRYLVEGHFKLEIHEVVKDVEVRWNIGNLSGVMTVEGTSMELENAFMGSAGKVLEFRNGELTVFDPLDPFWRTETTYSFIPEEVRFYRISPDSELAVSRRGIDYQIFLIGEDVRTISSGKFPTWLETYSINPYLSRMFVLETGNLKPESIDIDVKSEIFDETNPILGSGKSDKSRIFTSEGNVYTFLNHSSGFTIRKYRKDELVGSVDVYNAKVVSDPLPFKGHLVIPIEVRSGYTVMCLNRKSLNYTIADQVFSEPEDIRLFTDGSKITLLMLYDIVFKALDIDPENCKITDTHELPHVPSYVHSALKDGNILASSGRRLLIFKPDLSVFKQFDLEENIESIQIHKGTVLLNNSKLVYIPGLSDVESSPERSDLEIEYTPYIKLLYTHRRYGELEISFDYSDRNGDDLWINLEMECVVYNHVENVNLTFLNPATPIVVDISNYNFINHATLTVLDNISSKSISFVPNW